MKAVAVVNPRAGVAARHAIEAVRRSAADWPDLETWTTTGPGDAQALARRAVASGCEAVLAVGGDGTVNEVARGLLGSPAALGIIPAGSGNGLARTLRVPLSAERALREMAGAVVRPMDVGRINGRPFLNIAGAGFDAAVGSAFHEQALRGGRRGVMSYVRIALAMSWGYRCGGYTLAAGEHAFAGEAWLVAFVNGRQYGGAAVIAPGARMDDGLLDVIVIERATALELLAAAPRMFLGGLDRFKRYRRMAVSSAVLTAADAFPHHCDGEPETPVTRIEVTVDPKALNVLVPRATADDPLGPFGQT